MFDVIISTHYHAAVSVAGDGFSMRAEDAMLHGCVPVVIMDSVLPVWDPHLDWSAFSVRIAQANLPSLPHILKSLVQSGEAQVGPSRKYCDCSSHRCRPAQNRLKTSLKPMITSMSYHDCDYLDAVSGDMTHQITGGQHGRLAL
jgi:hypothetical protein